MEIRFKLNPKNEKDQVIIDVLSGEYSPSETIKNILYKMGTNGVEGQRVSFEGRGDNIGVSKLVHTNPIDGNEGNRMDTSFDDNQRQDREQDYYDEDISCFFTN